MRDHVRDHTSRALQGIAGALPQRFYELGRDSAVSPSEYPLAQIMEVLDDRICDLCRALHGQIVRKGSPMWYRYRFASHINDRRILVDIHRSEVDNHGRPTQPTLTPETEPSEALRRRYGHFITDRKAYRNLRVPARPTGRDFIFRRGAPGSPGSLVWAGALPDWALKQTSARVALASVRMWEAGEISAAQLRVSLIQCAAPCVSRLARAAAELRLAAQEARAAGLPVPTEHPWMRYADHYDGDLADHRDDWGEDLSDEDYWRLPEAILSADDLQVGLVRLNRRKYNKDAIRPRRAPAVVFLSKRARLSSEAADLQLEALFDWDCDRAAAWNPTAPNLYIYRQHGPLHWLR